MSEPFLDQATLWTLLEYDQETGVFRWRHRADVPRSWNTRYAGKRAGYSWSPSPNVTYWCIRIFDWPFLAHRLAFLYVLGHWPEPLADHRDLDGLNNRWVNLREATKAQNAANTRLGPRNRTGFKGVSRYGRTDKFRANIRLNGRQTLLGVFDTAEQAHDAYMVALKAKCGDFARSA